MIEVFVQNFQNNLCLIYTNQSQGGDMRTEETSQSEEWRQSRVFPVLRCISSCPSTHAFKTRETTRDKRRLGGTYTLHTTVTAWEMQSGKCMTVVKRMSGVNSGKKLVKSLWREGELANSSGKSFSEKFYIRFGKLHVVYFRFWLLLLIILLLLLF